MNTMQSAFSKAMKKDSQFAKTVKLSQACAKAKTIISAHK